MFLPQGEDPDSMVRKTGKEAFEALIDEAQTLTGFLFDTLTTKYGTDKGNLAKQAIALIEKIQDTVLQNLLLEDLSHRLGMNSADDLKKKLGFKGPQGVAPARHKALKGRGTPLRLAVALLVQHPQLGLNLIPQPALKHLQMAGIDLLVELLDLTRAQKMNSAQLLEQFRDTDEFSALRKLAQWEHQVADENLEQEFKKSLVWLNNQYIEQRYQELSLKQTHTKEEKIQLKKLIAAMKSRQ